MSIAAYSLAVRNHLRERLTNFYGDDLTRKNRNCKVMLDERPTADCGQEFIAIYGSYHKAGRDYMQAIEDQIGLTICVSRKIANIPPDYRGELAYIIPPTLQSKQTGIEGLEPQDLFYATWISLEERCREIVKLLAGPDRYRVMHEANNLLRKTVVTITKDGTTVTGRDEEEVSLGVNFTEPLIWKGTDAAPTQVEADHFWSYLEDVPPDADMVPGLTMKVEFGDAIRLQSVDLYG